MIWGISRYYFHFYMIHNFLIGCKTAIDKDHRSTMPCKHHLRLILIDAKREKKKLFRSGDIDRNKSACVLDYFET